jgi:hypothetical protein
MSTLLKDLKVGQCFTFPMFSTVYYVKRQMPSVNRTTIGFVNNNQSQNRESDIKVNPVHVEAL